MNYTLFLKFVLKIMAVEFVMDIACVPILCPAAEIISGKLSVLCCMFIICISLDSKTFLILELLWFNKIIFKKGLLLHAICLVAVVVFDSPTPLLLPTILRVSPNATSNISLFLYVWDSCYALKEPLVMCFLACCALEHVLVYARTVLLLFLRLNLCGIFYVLEVVAPVFLFCLSTLCW